MVSKNVLMARVKRNNLIKYSGKYFCDQDSDLITELNKSGLSVLIGIQKGGMYTLLGVENVYYQTKKGIKGSIPISEFSNKLHENALKKGKWRRYKYITINEEHKVWLNNTGTMLGLWNVILWLEKGDFSSKNI